MGLKIMISAYRKFTHYTHTMGNWESGIISCPSNDRFGRTRSCKKCGGIGIQAGGAGSDWYEGENLSKPCMIIDEGFLCEICNNWTRCTDNGYECECTIDSLHDHIFELENRAKLKHKDLISLIRMEPYRIVAESSDYRKSLKKFSKHLIDKIKRGEL